MTITTQNPERLTLAEMGEFVEGSRAVGFAAAGRAAIYEFLQQALRVQRYPQRNKGQQAALVGKSMSRRAVPQPARLPFGGENWVTI